MQPERPDAAEPAGGESAATVARASAPGAAPATPGPAGDDGESTLASPSNRTPALEGHDSEATLASRPAAPDAVDDSEATLAPPRPAAGDDSEATLATPIGPRAAPRSGQSGQFSADATLAGDGAALTPAASSAGQSGRNSSRGSPAIDGDLSGAPVYIEQSGRYLVRRQFGAGGQGVIWLAFDSTVGREVALKALDVPRLLQAGVNLPFTEQRFLREARITGQLEHPGIAPVHDLGRRADGSVYYVQKLVRGRTLRDALKECKTPEERLRLLPHYIDICQAIAYAHGRGVIHRDLKPENVMVGEFGETVVLDWGLAKVRGKLDTRGPAAEGASHASQSAGGPLSGLASSRSGPGAPGSQPGPQKVHFFGLDSEADAASSETRDGEIIGTPLYMSPEQAAGRLSEVDERSDVWALGAMLYEVLCGKAPFAGGKVNDVIARARKGIAPKVKELSPNAPAELAAVAERAIAKDREARYPSAQALAAEIEAFTLGGRVSAYSYTPWELFTKLVRRSPLASAMALVALVILIVSSVVVRRDHKQALSSLSETLAIHAASAEVEQRWAQAAAWYAAARAQEERPEARFGEAMAEQLAAKPVLRLGPHLKPAQGVAFSAAGDKIITTDSEGTLSVWDAAKGKLLSRVDAHKTLTPALALQPGQGAAALLATGGSDGRLRLWDLSLKEVADLAGSADPAQQPKPGKDHQDRSGYEEGSEGLPVLGISSATFSPDGRLLASASLEDGVSIWDVTTRARIGNLGAGRDRILGLTFTADGKRVFAGGADGAVVLRDLTGNELWRHHGHSARVRVIAVSPEGQWMASGGQDNTVLLYRMEQIEKGPRQAHEGAAPAEREEAATTSPSVKKLRGNDDDDEPRRLEAHQRAISGLAFSPDGTMLASTSRDGLVVVWDVAAGRPLVRLDADERAANGLAWSADGRRLAAAFQDQVVQVWQLPEHRRIRALGGHTEGLRAVAFAPGSGTLASTALDGTVRLWDRETGKQLRVLQTAATKRKSRAMAISPDGRQLASGGEGDSYEMWDLLTGERQRLVAGMPEGTSALTYHPRGGRLFSGHRKGMLRVIDPATGQVLAQTPSGQPVIEALAVSPDGRQVAASGSDGSLRVFDAQTLAPIIKLDAHNEAGRGVAYSPDGKLLASGGADRRLVIYNTADWSEARDLGGHRGRIHGVVFSPDGKLLGTSCADHTVRIFDPRSGQLIYSVTRHESAVMDLAWSPDGRTLASASTDKTLELVWVDGADAVPPPRQALSGVLGMHGLRLAGQRVETLAQRDRTFSGDEP